MELIKQSAKQIIESDPYKLIERAGRVCYKSEEKITAESAPKFVTHINSRKHYSVLEHGHIAFKVADNTIHAVKQIKIITNPFDVPVLNDRFFECSMYEHNIISGNFRAWKEYLSIPGIHLEPGLADIASYLTKVYPEIFSFNEQHYEFAKVMPIEEMSLRERFIHCPVTYHFITNRGVTHELVRHRPCAFSQESTRYVKYGDDMQFILPVWLDHNLVTPLSLTKINKMNTISKEEMMFRNKCLLDQEYYCKFIDLGWKPQQAREVLPNALKTEIVVTATLRQWYHIFSLRCSSAAHPQIRELMIPVYREMITKEPAIFESLANTF